jgi:hypothetical protein
MVSRIWSLVVGIALTAFVACDSSHTLGNAENAGNWYWHEADSPILLDSTFIVPEGVVLSIEAGTEIIVNDEFGYIRVDGVLHVDGDENNPVRFRGAGGHDWPTWRGIRIKKSYGSVLRYVVIEPALSSNGGGLYIQGGSIELDHVVVRGCRISFGQWSHGGGIYIGDSATVLMTDCVIDNNRIGFMGSGRGSGGGMYVEGGSNVVAERCAFTSNRSMEYLGGGVAVKASAVRFTECLFVGNRMAKDGQLSELHKGNALLVYDSAHVVIERSVFIDNGEHEGTDIKVREGSIVEFLAETSQVAH